MPSAPGVARRIRDSTPIRRRKQLARARVRARTWSSAARGLPDFLVIGAQRCGTSSLYKHLGRHPDVVASIRKEVEFFSTSFPEGESWYRAHFPLQARLDIVRRVTGRRPLTFEATPDYMLDPRAAERAADLVPDARIIALLRDPVDRAFSQYQHNRRLGHEDLDFGAALEAEERRTAGEVERLIDDRTYRAIPLRRHGYVARGMYADQLASWIEQFGPARVRVVMTDDLFGDPATAFSALAAFLGVRPWAPDRFENYSYAAGTATTPEKLDPGIRADLEAEFAAADRRLADLLGAEPSWIARRR